MAATPIAVFVKSPTAVKDYALRWTDWLNGDSIATSAWAVVAGTMVVGVTSLGGDLTLVWLSGGAAGENCLATNTITTVGGRTETSTIQLSCRE